MPRVDVLAALFDNAARALAKTAVEPDPNAVEESETVLDRSPPAMLGSDRCVASFLGGEESRRDDDDDGDSEGLPGLNESRKG